MVFTENSKNYLIENYSKSESKKNAISRLKNLCKSYSFNLHFLDFDFKEYSLDEVDDIYLLILS